MPPQDPMLAGSMPQGFFNNAHMRHPSPPHGVNQMSPHPMHGHMMPQMGPGFLPPRFPGGRGLVRMPGHMDFNGPVGPVSAGGMPGGIEMRPGPMVMSPMPRMSHPPGQMQSPLNTVGDMNSYEGMRGQAPPGGVPGNMTPLPMASGPVGARPWPVNSQMSGYSSPSPGTFNGPLAGPGAPGTPIMPSPQDSTNSGENMYAMMKTNMPGGLPVYSMGGPNGGMGPMGADGPHTVINGQYMHNERLVEGMKSSPHNGAGTPRDDATPGNGEMTNYGGSLHYQDGINPNHNESAEILKIKQSMQEEAKRFEKETPPDSSHPDFFMQ